MVKFFWGSPGTVQEFFNTWVAGSEEELPAGFEQGSKVVVDQIAQTAFPAGTTGITVVLAILYHWARA